MPVRCGVFSSLSERSIGNTCAVDERPSGKPMASDASRDRPIVMWRRTEIASPQRTTCARPSPKMSRRSLHNRLG